MGRRTHLLAAEEYESISGRPRARANVLDTPGLGKGCARSNNSAGGHSYICNPLCLVTDGRVKGRCGSGRWGYRYRRYGRTLLQEGKPGPDRWQLHQCIVSRGYARGTIVAWPACRPLTSKLKATPLV